MVIKIKSKEQIKVMKEGGRITAGTLQAVLSAVAVGVTTAELDKIAEEFIVSAGGEPAFKRIPNYPFATCLNLNEGVVHGLPSKQKLKEGDLLSIDLGTYYKGLNTDIAWTVYVGDKKQAPSPKLQFLEVGEKALWAAIDQCRIGNRVGDISAAMEKILRGAGYSPVETLVGHGIGEKLHEEPQIPCLASPYKGAELKEGMTLATEVIYAAGKPALKLLSDNWTFVTADGSLAGLFEHTVAVSPTGPIVLTAWKAI